MSIHKEKLSFLCFLRSSLSDRFNFFVVSSLHECSVISTISSLHHSILHTIHVTIVRKSYQRVMGALTCGVPIFCMGAYKHNAVVAIKIVSIVFLPAGTINFSTCQDTGTIRGRKQNEGGVNITRQCIPSRVLAHVRSVRHEVLVAASNECSCLSRDLWCGVSCHPSGFTVH